VRRLRGGSWDNYPMGVRVSKGRDVESGNRDYTGGLRCVGN
jgi:formylglycine-generating enzyme required for sulfatase activity